MTRKTPLYAAAATAALWLAGSGTAVAQTAPPVPADLESVTVVAPRIVYQKGYRPGSAAPRQVRMTQQTAIVDASDLDLTRIADMETLESRVGDAAQRVCHELAELHPLGEPDIATCVRRASADAMAQVRPTNGRVARD